MTNIQLRDVGVFKIEKIFFESYYPILFSCRSGNDDLYLCVCCWRESDKTKWLVTKTSSKTIINMLENKITLRDAFLSGDKRITITHAAGVYVVVENDPKDWNPTKSIYLPTAGEYMDAEHDEFADEIKFYKMQQLNGFTEAHRKGLIFENKTKNVSLVSSSYREIGETRVDTTHIIAYTYVSTHSATITPAICSDNFDMNSISGFTSMSQSKIKKIGKYFVAA